MQKHDKMVALEKEKSAEMTETAITAIETHGSFKGTILTVKRILRCNPFGTKGYDPVPTIRRKKK